MKILICGGRDFNNKLYFQKSIYQLISKNDLIIHGGAKGADTIANQYAKYFNLKTKVYLPNYKTWGKLAPIVRNTEMVKECDKVIAFWDGKSRGTKNTIDSAYRYNKDIHIFYY